MTTTRTREPSARPKVVRSQVEPKLVERRREVAHAGQVRRRRLAVLALGAALVVAAALAVLFSPLTDVDHIRVDGAADAGTAAVVAASGLERGEPLVQVDLAAVRDAVRAVPWVRSAQVTREWPATVRIVVTEEQPVAMIDVGGDRLVVSATGRVLEAGSVPHEGLTPIVVERGSARTDVEPGDVVADGLLAAVQAIERMDDQFADEVVGATLSADSSLSFELADGAVARLGPTEDLSSKLVALEAVLAQVDGECRETIDVREPSRVTVSRTCDGLAATGDDTSAETMADTTTEQVDG